MDAKNRRKFRRAAERRLREEGYDPNTMWLSMSPTNEKKPKSVPGRDFYVEDADMKSRHENNVWDENLDQVIAFIKAATAPDSEKFDENGRYKPDANRWSWARNMDCKYVNIRIDMRDGGFILIDSKGKRISLDALKFQYKGENS